MLDQPYTGHISTREAFCRFSLPLRVLLTTIQVHFLNLLINRRFCPAQFQRNLGDTDAAVK